MSYLYRLENKDGEGIFNFIEVDIVQTKTYKFMDLLGGLTIGNFDENQIDDFIQISLSFHKPIEEEFDNTIIKNKIKLKKFHCAFNSYNQLLRWFPIEGLIDLLNYDLFVSTYTKNIGTYFESHNQVIFLRNKNDLLNRNPLSKFIDELI